MVRFLGQGAKATCLFRRNLSIWTEKKGMPPSFEISSQGSEYRSMMLRPQP